MMWFWGSYPHLAPVDGPLGGIQNHHQTHHCFNIRRTCLYPACSHAYCWHIKHLECQFTKDSASLSDLLRRTPRTLNLLLKHFCLFECMLWPATSTKRNTHNKTTVHQNQSVLAEIQMRWPTLYKVRCDYRRMYDWTWRHGVRQMSLP